MDRNTKITCKGYLDFVRSKPCCACGAPGPSDPDHLKARGAGSGKRNDFTIVPLCRSCHDERHALGTKHFEVNRIGVNLWAEATWLLIEFLVYQQPSDRDQVEYTVGKTEGWL